MATQQQTLIAQTTGTMGLHPGLRDLPPAERTILPPPGGWEEESYYVVAVSVNSNNPVFTAIFYTGYLNENGTPGNYNGLTSTPNELIPLRKCHYLRVLKKLGSRSAFDDLATPLPFPAGSRLVNLNDEPFSDEEGVDRITPAGSEWIVDQTYCELRYLSCPATGAEIIPDLDEVKRRFKAL